MLYYIKKWEGKMKKITIKVQKTVQERPYEPFTCALELEESAGDKISNDKLDELYFQKYDEMEHRLSEIIESRLKGIK